MPYVLPYVRRGRIGAAGGAQPRPSGAEGRPPPSPGIERTLNRPRARGAAPVSGRELPNGERTGRGRTRRGVPMTLAYVPFAGGVAAGVVDGVDAAAGDPPNPGK